jgi:hypothetical protein
MQEFLKKINIGAEALNQDTIDIVAHLCLL